MTKTLTTGAVLGAALLLTACDEPIACDAMARASITLDVVDESGTAIEDATATFTLDGGDIQDCDDMGSGSFVCAWEQTGDFEITVDAWGYDPTIIQQTITADECHVQGEAIEAVLMPEACTATEVPSVLVTVTDGQGADVTTGDVTWNLADEDDLNEPCDSLGGNQWVCGYEQAGDLRIEIDNAGPYEPFSQIVTVTADECHVLTEDLDAVLQYLPD